MQKIKKLLPSFFLLIFILSLFLKASPARAFSWPSPQSAFMSVFMMNPGPMLLDQILGNIGVDKNEVRNTSNMVNVQRQKQQPPQVSLSFFPANPSPGEEVTVAATPSYFLSDPKNLYFTWYIKHSGDDSGDVNAMKIEAGRLIANGGWDWDPDGNGVPDGPPYAVHTDDDGYDAVFGGEDQRNKAPRCYIHDWPSGNDYELPGGCEHLFPDDGIDALGGADGGDPAFGMDQERFWRTDPRNFDTRGSRQKDEATVVGLGMFEFKFNYQNGDKVGVAVEGASYQATAYPDSGYKTMWALVKNDCAIGEFLPHLTLEEGTTTESSTAVTVASGLVNAPSGLTCAYFAYSPPGVCQPNGLAYMEVIAASSIDPDGGSITPDGCTGGTPLLTTGCTYPIVYDPAAPRLCMSFTYNAPMACQPNGLQYSTVDSTTPYPCSGGASVGGVDPAPPVPCTYVPPVPSGGIAANADAIPADGLDPAEWPASGYLRIGTEIIRYSTVTATAGGGIIFSNLERGAAGTTAAFHPDNAVITGNTTLVETRVVTETSFNTQQNNFLVATTTTTTTTVTDVRGVIIEGPTAETTADEEIVANDEEFSMPVSRINDCLEKNMLSPAEGNAFEKLKVNLFYTPANPMNDSSSSGDDADYLVLTAGLENVKNEDYLIYDWTIYGPADTPNPVGWGPALGKADLPDSTQTHGVGLKSLKFKLNFPWGNVPQYLKAKLTITEKLPGETTETMAGNASVVILISPMSNRMGVYSAIPESASPAPQVSLGAERCTGGVQSAVCPVAKDEIVGLRLDGASSFSDILWTVNGERVKYAECYFDGCSEESHTDTMFIPILNDIGSRYTVSVTAIDEDTGEKVTLTRTLEVVKPAMRIVSTDTGLGSTGARAVFLGTYIPLDPASPPTGGAGELEDFSETDFQSLPGATASFRMEFNIPPDRFTDQGKTTWFLDGQDAATVAGATVNGATLSFPVNKTIGESYSVTANAIYRQDPLIQQMLNHYWGVRIDQLYNTQLSGKVDLSVVNTLNGQLAGADANKTLPRKMLAALTSGAPSYLIFLFRTVLTTGLLLFFIRFILSFVPKNYED